MDVRGMTWLADQRSGRALSGGDVVASDGFEDSQGILACVLYWRIAVDCTDTEELRFRVQCGQKNGEGILNSADIRSR